jgi:Sulfotransferase family
MTPASSASVSERPIIVLGCPRSGTTLLTTMLHAHPRIAMPPETRFLLSLYQHRARFGDLRDEQNRTKLATAITGRKATHFHDLHIDADTVVKRIVEGPPTLGSALAAVWEEFAAARGKPRWGEKRPAYTLWTGALQRLFPDAQFVGLVRDPRACVASLLKTTWWKGGFERALTAWVRSDWYMRRFARTADSETYFQLQYEELVVDPRPHLERLCAYLGEDFDEHMLDHTQAAADIVPQRARHHVLAHGEVDPSRIEAWRAVLTPEQVGLIERVCKRRMEQYGYPPSGIGVSPPRELTAAFVKRLARSEWTHRTALLRDVRQRRRDPNPLAAVRTP